MQETHRPATQSRQPHDRKPQLLRVLKWIVPAAVIAGLSYLAFAPKAVESDLGKVFIKPMDITIEDEGETRVRERYLITSPLPGRVLRIDLEPGDFIEQGDHLATIIPEASRLLDPRTRAQAQAVVSAAEASLTRAEEQVELATVEVEATAKAHRRNTQLHRSESISDAAFENSERAFLTARHTLHAAESGVELSWFELEQARAALLHAERDLPRPEPTSRLADPEFAPETPADPPADQPEHPEDPDNKCSFIIRSPIDGQVLRVAEKSGRAIQPGTQLLEIGDPRELEIAIEVLSQDAVKIAPGQLVRIEHWGGSSPLTGHVRYVEPSAFTRISALGVDEQRVNVIVDFEPPPASGEELLGDGFRVEARIVVWENHNTLQVPAAALFRQDRQWAVFLVDPATSRARLTTIEVGHQNGESAEILSGVSEGDHVILHPGGNITNGTRIKPRK